MDEKLMDNLWQLAGGSDVGSKEDFIKEFLADDQLRRNLHELAGGNSVGSYGDFLKEVGVNIKPIKKNSAKATTKPVSGESVLKPNKQPTDPDRTENLLKTWFNDPTSLSKSAAELKNTRQKSINETINKNDFEAPQTRFDEARNAKSEAQIRYEQARDDRLRIEKQIEDDKTGMSLEFMAPQYNDAKKREEIALWESKVDPHAIGIAEQIKKRRDEINDFNAKEISRKSQYSSNLDFLKPSNEYSNQSLKDKTEKQLIKEFAPVLSAMDNKSMLVALKGSDFVRKREETIDKSKELFKKEREDESILGSLLEHTDRVDEELRKAIGNDKIWEGIQNWDNYKAEVAFSDKRDLEYEKLIKPYIDQINTKGTKLNKIYRQSIYDFGVGYQAKALFNAAADEIIDMQYQGLQLSNAKAVREAILDAKNEEIRKVINNDKVWEGWNNWENYYKSVYEGKTGKRDLEYEKMMQPYLEDAQNPETRLGKAYKEYVKEIDPYNKVSKELYDLPSKYKRALIAQKYSDNVANEFEKQYKFNTDFGKGLYNLIGTVRNGVEKNFFYTPANLAYTALDRFGVDFGTKKLIEGAASDNIPISGRMSKKFDRPGTEKKATFEKNGKLFTIGFKSDGSFSGYYDSNDEYPVSFLQDPLTEEQKAEYYKKAKWDRNWKSDIARGGKITMDVFATLGYAKALSLVSKSARVVEFGGGFLQYYPQSLVSDIRSGMPLDEAYAHSAVSVGTSMMLEIMSPMVGKIAQKGRTITSTALKLKLKELLAAIGKREVTPLKAIVTTIKRATLNASLEVLEEETDMPLQVLINRSTNAYLDGDIDDVEFPNILDYKDTAISTLGGIALSVTHGGIGNYRYLRSNEYLDELRYKTFDPKNNVGKTLDIAVEKKLLTHEESARTKAVAVAMEPHYKSFEDIKVDDPRVDVVKQKIIGLASDIEYLREKVTGNSIMDKDANAEIEKQTEKLKKAQEILIKLSKDPKSVPADIFEEKTSKQPVSDKEGIHNAYDFDGTLVDNNGELTDLGKQVRDRIESGEEITIVTSRNTDDAAEIYDILGDKPNLKVEATGDEAKKRDVLDNLGISPDEYFDSDTEKLNAIRGSKSDLVNSSNLYIQEIINIDTGESQFEIYNRDTKRAHEQFTNVSFQSKEEADAYLEEELNAIRGDQVAPGSEVKNENPNVLTEADLRNNVPIEIDGKKVKSYSIGDNVGGGAGTIEVEFEGREDTGGVISPEEAKSLKNTYIIDKDGKIYESGTEKQVSITKQGAKVEPANVSDVEAKRADIERRRQDTESKIKRKDLFADGSIFSNELGGSGINSVPTYHTEINGIEFVQFSNPNTGIVDVIMTGTSDNDFVGYYRIYENGKPTEKWSSKFENQSRNKENFKTMISGVQSMLPQRHQYTEKTSISTDGLRVWAEQLNRGYELQRDINGNIITAEVSINGDAINNELGIEVNKGNFSNISVTTKEEFNSVKKALIPYLEKFGLSEKNIRWENGTVKIDLPVLKKNTSQKTEESHKADIERRRQEELKNLSPKNLSVMASDYLLTGGVGAILSSDYFIQSLMGSFINASSKIAEIRNKYANEINAKYGNLADFMKTDLYNTMMNEIRDAISKSYSTSEAQTIFDQILSSPSGVNPKLGNQLSVRLDAINNTVEQINAKYDAELAALEQEAKKTETKTETKTEEVTYQIPKSNPLNLDLKNLPTNKNEIISLITDKLESLGEIIYQDENGNPCGRAKKAKFGAKTTKFEPGHKWSIVEVVKGKSHEQGGTDIKL